VNARELALDLLGRWSKSRQLADELLERSLAESSLIAADRAFATELFYGCLRHKLALEFLLTQLAKRSPRPLVADIVKLGLYQLLFLSTPAHAAVNETVALAKYSASAAEAKFVNAILRKAAATDLAATLRKAEPWVQLSHPRWLWERWRVRWGDEQATALCKWNNQPPPVYVRLNTLKTGNVAPSPVLEEATAASGRDARSVIYRVLEAKEFFDSDAWKNGEFYVQDPSTLIAVDELDPQAGESVLDVCAAPGGKTTYIAQKMQDQGRIIAADSSNSRLALVGDNCRRLGVTIVATLACEGERLDRCLRGEQFDRVLVDAPCSNTGVMRRRPDLRWRIEEKEISRLANLQLKLLGKAAEFMRTGGVLVYSTCSLEPEENEGVVEQFGKSHQEFVRETTRSTFPPRDGIDGAFIARFRKKNAA
jgi:16S rRNA (cytosine967-C5)-methyltransferase